MKVAEYAKSNEITLNQAKKLIKAVLGVDVSKDRTLTPEELDKIAAAIENPEVLAANMQHLQLPESVQTDVQPNPQPDSNIISNDEPVSVPVNLEELDETPIELDVDVQLDSENVQDCPTENAITVSNPDDAEGHVQYLAASEKNLKNDTIQLKTEVSDVQGRGAGIASALAFMRGMAEGEQEVLDMFTEQSLEVFDQLQTTIDQQIAEISQSTSNLLGKISSQRSKNQERLQAIRSRVSSMIHKD
ncbi:hypothetical protein NIES4106_62400 (plasmid) [Fischerella sp. NIES-4106]|nr:hypothetical protein NIES4106_62400 [Fischerella sp. NIES-4106]